MHASQFWWAWPLRFGDMASFQIWPNFPYGPILA